MKTHFELPINYENSFIKVNVQIISNQLPLIKYVVWSNDEGLNKKLLSNVKQFYFNTSFNLNKNNTLEIKNNVSYDYIDDENIVTDAIFEFSVWNALFNLSI